MSDSEPSPPRRRYQFSLGRLFLVTTLLSVLVAGWAGLTRRDGSMPLGYFVMIVAAPLAVMIVLSLLHAVLRFLQQRR